MTDRYPSLCAAYETGASVLLRGPAAVSIETLVAGARGVAAALGAAPVPGRKVLVSCADRGAFAQAALGAWEAGFAVSLPPNRRVRTLSELARRDEVHAHLHDGDADGIDVRGLEPDDAATSATLSGFDAGRLLATVYTSGSTADHRAADKSAAQLLGEAAVLVDAFELDGLGPVVSTVPPHHIYGLLFGVLIPMRCGTAMVAETPLLAEEIAATVKRVGARVLVSTPAVLRALETLTPGALDGVERVFSSGGPLATSTAEMIHDRFGLDVTEVLGSTETGGIAWRRVCGPHADPLWRPLPTVGVTADADGRLMLDSPFVPADAASPYPGDDRIELMDDGRFRHLGRMDDVVKVGGKRVSLRELEQRVRELPGVDDAAAVAEPTEDGRGQRLRVAVVAPGADADVLREALLQWFDPVVVPRRLQLVDALPREPSGKLPRARLLEVLAPPQPVRSFVFGDGHETDGGGRECDVAIPDDLVFFAGHFPGNPVLPGVAQIEGIVLDRVAEYWPELGAPRQLNRVKFKRKIGKGERLRLRLTPANRGGDRRVAFELWSGDEVCASGIMVFAG